MSKTTTLGPNRASAAEPADFSTLDGIVKALYDSISFPPGKQPNYERMRVLFHKDARLIPPSSEKNGEVCALDLETFITKSRESIVVSGLERKGFVETEIARRTQSFGNIVHVFSTYESRSRADDPAPAQRGINSIQIVKELGRFWVMTILWDVERPGHPIPRPYLL
ncbi:MAG TPA: hypothetical protein VLY03_11050 [Bacteroidota bacterium]|nr:hypothetical protein [Bacteroidota bacterium]